MARVKKVIPFQKLPNLEQEVRMKINAIGQSHIMPGMTLYKLYRIFDSYHVVDDFSLIQNMDKIADDIEREIEKC
jgi:hypothetical protein